MRIKKLLLRYNAKANTVCKSDTFRAKSQCPREHCGPRRHCGPGMMVSPEGTVGPESTVGPGRTVSPEGTVIYQVRVQSHSYMPRHRRKEGREVCSILDNKLLLSINPQKSFLSL